MEINGGRKNNGPAKDVNILIPRNYKYVILHSKGETEVADGIKVSNNLALK